MRRSLDEGVAELIPLLKQGRLIVFAGSGVSVSPPSNLPTWDDLLAQFIGFCRDLQPHLAPERRFEALLDDAVLQRQKAPGRVASVLKRKLKEIQITNPDYNVERAFRTWLLETLNRGDPNDCHKLIVGTDYPFILTSNYDGLLERAAREGRYGDLHLRTYTYTEPDKMTSALFEKRPCIIHVHGDVEGVALDDFVFTAEDYVSIRKKYHGYALVLQALFLHYSVLFVGYGGSDPHFEDLVEEISFYLDWATSSTLPRYYLALKNDKVGEVLDEYKDKLRTDLVVLETYDQTPELLGRLQEALPRPRS